MLITSTFPNPLYYLYKNVEKTTVRVQTHCFKDLKIDLLVNSWFTVDVSRSRLANSPVNFWESKHTALMIIPHQKFLNTNSN